MERSLTLSDNDVTTRHFGTRGSVIVAAGILGVIWVVSASFIADRYLDSRANAIIQTEKLANEERAVSLSNSIQHRLEFLHGVARSLTGEALVIEALRQHNTSTPAAPLPATNSALWQKDPALRRLDDYLAQVTAALQVDVIWVMNAAGDCIASSNVNESDSFVGHNFAEREYFRRAAQGLPGHQFAVGKVSHLPGLYFSAPVTLNGHFAGVIVTKRNLAQLAYLVRQDDSFLSDAYGVIILSKDKHLEMHALPDATVNRLTPEERVARYRLRDLPVLDISPWHEDHLRHLLSIDQAATPTLLSVHKMQPEGVGVYTLSDMGRVLPNAQDRRLTFLLLAISGVLLIVAVSASLFYLHEARRVKRLLSHRRQALEESERTYRGILDSLHEAVYVHDQTGRILYVNDGALRMYGYPREFFVGKTPEPLAAPDRNDFTEVVDKLQKAYQGAPQTLEFWGRHADGKDFPKEVHLYPGIWFGEKVVIAIAQDISQRKQLEDEQALATQVYLNSAEAMIVTDARNRIVAINPAFTELTGYSREEVLGKNPSLLSSGRHDAAFYQAIWQSLAQEGKWQGEVWNRKRDGTIYPEWLTINTIRDTAGAIVKHVALFSDISQRKQAEELIWRQANFDTLTQLPNRRMFRDRLEQEMKKSDRSGQGLALLFIDLDRFKEVNNTLGHEAGDRLLIEAATRIASCVRGTDTVARLGGDEFTVILTQQTDNAHVEEVAFKIISVLSCPFHLDSGEAYVTASIGITVYPSDGRNLEALLKNADQAMYAAKAAGRNRFSYFTQALQQAAQARLELSNDLRIALSDGQFQIYLQPIVELSTEQIHKAEVLLRWQHPVRGLVSPTERWRRNFGQSDK
ncbi:MAG: diguanylate cyclase [Nitrosomonadales bacterium]|nr:diguanylate cyclase [Nitrosomonadales bacterium]